MMGDRDEAQHRRGLAAVLRSQLDHFPNGSVVHEALTEGAKALERQRVPKWQPIDTAPKDKGLLVSDGDGIMVAICCDDSWRGPRGILRTPPTHWMPLPAAPEANDE